uniref:Uncharacterized protein n=1 Tax=Cacopsylla melanoneura TaxID=428564 RepID=A0A8D9BW22_9HEMI
MRPEIKNKQDNFIITHFLYLTLGLQLCTWKILILCFSWAQTKNTVSILHNPYHQAPILLGGIGPWNLKSCTPPILLQTTTTETPRSWILLSGSNILQPTKHVKDDIIL